MTTEQAVEIIKLLKCINTMGLIIMSIVSIVFGEILYQWFNRK